MPTVVVLDVSFSMCLPVVLPNSAETYSSLQLAVHGINSLLDYLASNFKFEFVALIAYSSSCHVVSSFTIDFEMLKAKLAELEEQDACHLEPVLTGINNLVLEEWGNTTPCHVILVTNGVSQKHSELEKLRQKESPLPFAFPGKLSIVVVAPPGPPHNILSEVLTLSGGNGSLLQVGSSLTTDSLKNVFQTMAKFNYTEFRSVLKCGHLMSDVVLSPAPMPYTKIGEFECQTFCVGSEVAVCGFLDLQHLEGPAAVSRHLVFSYSSSSQRTKATSSQTTADNEEIILDERKIPYFCVLLHGSLKIENKAALCQVAPDWFGILYSTPDSKKKSNLMLALLEPGYSPIPWLGDLRQLGIPDPNELDTKESFPIPPTHKPSYIQNNIVWIKKEGLYWDIQKMLRLGRSLPEKTGCFYKDLNRLRKGAISLGFTTLIESLPAILERECTQLPGGAHPDCALQLTHAANVLRQIKHHNPAFEITPLPTHFQPCSIGHVNNRISCQHI